ncbi:MAG: S-adenosylmethionine:tRNA ribosyltransferase-isomerase [Bacteroidota bacterium]
MQHPKHLRIEDYTYELPDDRVAKYPLQVRDASKLLIYKDGEIQEDTYVHIAAHIPQKSLLVFNQSKVVHARLLFQKLTGGIIEVFCLEPDDKYADIQTAMLQKASVSWKCMVGGASKWKHGMVLTLNCTNPAFTVSASVIEKNAGSFTLQLHWSDPSLTFAEVLHFVGKVPLPPYLNRDADISDEDRYQTIFAKEEGSVAAPTAGLHFTEQVLQSLADKHIDTTFVTLHVGAGTFKPVKSETMQEHDMHAEWIEVDQHTINQLLQHLQSGIVAVGTTSLRTLESLYWLGCKILNGENIDFSGIAVSQWDPYEKDFSYTAEQSMLAISDYLKANNRNRLITRTQILIAPGYKFRIVNGLVTNFHQPQSTLLLLVAALIGKNWKNVYHYALVHNYRFLSYGDGSLFWAK